MGHLHAAAPVGRHQTVTARLDQAVTRVRDAAQRVAESHGLTIFDLQFRRESIGWVLRVMVDRPWEAAQGPETPDQAVGIEDCQRVSHDLSALLDLSLIHISEPTRPY